MKVYFSRAFFCQYCGRWIGEKELFQEVHEHQGETTLTLKVVYKCCYCSKPVYIEIVTRIKYNF